MNYIATVKQKYRVSLKSHFKTHLLADFTSYFNETASNELSG